MRDQDKCIGARLVIRLSNHNPPHPRNCGGPIPTPFVFQPLRPTEAYTPPKRRRAITVTTTVINHKLRILVLKQLIKKPRAGYGLIKDISEETGWKPSYGSIYPLLDNLRKEGLVKQEVQGKKKIYHLTRKGKEEVQKLKFSEAEFLEQMQKLHLLTMKICGIKEDPLPVHLLLEQLHQPTPYFKKIMKLSIALRSQFGRLVKEGLIEQHQKEICTILEDAIKKLQQLSTG